MELLIEQNINELKEIANSYNKLPIGDIEPYSGVKSISQMKNRPKNSTIPEYNTKLKYVVAFWMRDIQIHVFGEHYDLLFASMATLDWSEGEYQEKDVVVDNNKMYKQMMTDYYLAFLYSIVMGLKAEAIEYIQSHQGISDLTKELVLSKSDKKLFIEKLQTTSQLDLLFVIEDMTNYGFFNFWDVPCYLDFIEFLPVK